MSLIGGPVCTTEFVALAKRHRKLKELGAELVGLSVDQAFSHIKWVGWIIAIWVGE